MKSICFKFFLLLFLLIPLYAHGQKKISKVKTEDDIFSLIAQAERLAKKDPKKALDYLEQALSRSLKEGNKLGEAKSYSTLGKINYQQGLYSQSSDFYLKALAVFQELKDRNNLIETRKSLGQSYQANGNYEQALEQYNLALAEATSLKRTNEIITIKYKIGSVYEKQGKSNEALKTYNEILVIEEGRDNKTGIISANNSIGNVYLKQEKTDKALEHYENAQNIATESKDSLKIVESFDKIGNTLNKQKDFKGELEVRKKSVEVNVTLNDSTALANEYVAIGKLYLSQGTTSAALAYLNKGIKLSEVLGDLDKQAEAYLALSEVYKNRKDFGMALRYFEEYVSVKDSLALQKKNNLASLVSFNDELSLKQKKIDLLEKDMLLLKEEKNSSEMLVNFLSVGLMVVFGSSWLIYNSARKRRIANQVLALKSLRSQMNPHFIFNALNSVNNYISKNDERSANKYLSDFSKLMRTVMENSQHEFISLSTELNILQLYLSLEHSRFKEKFDYELNVSEDIRPDQIEIPPMLIQPYIENAVWHGLRYKEEKGFLKVAISTSGAILKVTIEDDGIGRKKSQEIKTINQKDKVSTGLKNTESRLKIINELYRTKMKVEIEDLYKEKQSGTRVTIYITPAKNHSR